MKFTREECANWRTTWTAITPDGYTLLVVRDGRPLNYWWRLRRGRQNIAGGWCSGMPAGRRLVVASLRSAQASATSALQGVGS